jgi:hypothetical protein
MHYKQILLYVGFAIAQLPLIGIWFSKKPKSADIVYITPFATLVAFGGLYEAIVTKQLHIDTTIWFKVYTLLEFICINYFFLKLLDKRHHLALKSLLMLFILVFIGLQIYWISGGSESTDSWLALLETILVYVASMFWFKDIFANMTLQTFWDSPAFYFVSGFILYFSGTLFLFLMSDFVFTPQEMSKHWIINVVLSLLLSIIIIIGIWKNHQKSRQYSG